MVQKAEIESFPSISTTKDGSGHSLDEAAILIAQLRDHLETHQQVERTTNMKRNVVIRIDRRNSRRYQQGGKTLDTYRESVINISQCCTPIASLVGNLSYETPSTQSTSLSLDGRDSNSFLHSCEDSYRFTNVTALSRDSTSEATGDHDRRKAFLRLKEDILSEGSTVGGGFGSTTDGVSTDCDLSDHDITDHEEDTYESSSAGSVNSATRRYGFGRSRVDSRDDEGGDGDDEMDDESLPLDTETRDTIDETSFDRGADSKPEQRCDNMLSSLSPSVDDYTASIVVDVSASFRETPLFASLTSASEQTSMTRNTHSFDHVDRDESIKGVVDTMQGSHPSPMCSPDQISGTNDEQSNEDELSKPFLGIPESESHSQALCTKDCEAHEVPLQVQNALELSNHDEVLVYESGRSKQQVVAEIGRALKEASLNATLRLNSSFKIKTSSLGEIKELSDSESIEIGELTIVSSESLVSRHSTISRHNDVFLSIESLYKIPFIHGSFAAAAPLVMCDFRWKRILRKLMPGAHGRVVAQMRKNGSVATTRVTPMMKWAENNPVVAAFGILSNQYENVATPEPEMSAMPTPMASNKVGSLHEFKKTPPVSSPVTRQSIPPLEWNVFLDPLIVSQLNAAMMNELKARTLEEKADSVSVSQHHLSRLVKRMILSHGSFSQLLSEAFGFHRTNTFAALVLEVEHPRYHKQVSEATGKKYERRPNLKKSTGDSISSKSQGTSMFATKWLATLAAALHLGKQLNDIPVLPTKRKDHNALVENLLADSSDAMILKQQMNCGLLLCLGFHDGNSTCTDGSGNSFGESAKYISGILGGPLRLLLNLRSRQVPSQVWARLVDYMRQNDVLVESVASFDVDEIRSIGSLVAAPVKQYRLFHSAGDLQKACHAGDIKEGDCVFFNAASLIATDQDVMNALLCGLDEYNDEIVFSEFAYPRSITPASQRTCKASIEDYKKRFHLNIGCYIQEVSVSPRTLQSLVAFFNSHSGVYNLGLAYGGINGKAIDGGLDGDGFGMQRFMGARWDSDAKPLYEMQPLAPWHNLTVQRALRAGSWGPLGTVHEC